MNGKLKKEMAEEAIGQLTWDSIDSRLSLIGLIQPTPVWGECKGRKFWPQMDTDKHGFEPQRHEGAESGWFEKNNSGDALIMWDFRTSSIEMCRCGLSIEDGKFALVGVFVSLKAFNEEIYRLLLRRESLSPLPDQWCIPNPNLCGSGINLLVVIKPQSQSQYSVASCDDIMNPVWIVLIKCRNFAIKIVLTDFRFTGSAHGFNHIHLARN